jgi:hypothetical protein
MAIYPDDATVSSTAFSVVSSNAYTNTGTTVEFALPSTISYPGEVIAIADNVIQDISSYVITDSGKKIFFVVAPAASNLTFKTISLPARFRTVRQYPGIYSVSYSNTSTTVVDSNTYLLNGVRTAFSLPSAALGKTSQKDSIIVTISGVVQANTFFTYPSSTLSYNGVDLDSAPSTTTLEIRTVVSEASSIGRFTDMRDRKPSNGYSINREFAVSKFESQAGYERRRLTSRRSRRSFELTYTNVTGVEKQAIEDFYIARNGEYETFTFDLSHINSTGTVRTRFDGPLDITQVISSGTDLTQNIYIVKLRLREDYS